MKLNFTYHIHQVRRLCMETSNRISTVECKYKLLGKISPSLALNAHFFQQRAASVLQLLPNSS